MPSLCRVDLGTRAPLVIKRVLYIHERNSVEMYVLCVIHMRECLSVCGDVFTGACMTNVAMHVVRICYKACNMRVGSTMINVFVKASIPGKINVRGCLACVCR